MHMWPSISGGGNPELLLWGNVLSHLNTPQEHHCQGGQRTPQIVLEWSDVTHLVALQLDAPGIKQSKMIKQGTLATLLKRDNYI